MSLTRRAFVKLLSLASLLKWSPRLFAAPSIQDFESTLAAFLDTLMPADEAPSATELNVDHMLLQKAGGDARYTRLLLNGCLWLENTALREFQSPFAELDESQRARIVAAMEQASSRSLANVFFANVQKDLFELYYSQPASWQGLGIDRPPQPMGYLDYQKPPAATS